MRVVPCKSIGSTKSSRAIPSQMVLPYPSPLQFISHGPPGATGLGLTLYFGLGSLLDLQPHKTNRGLTVFAGRTPHFD